ncbi:MAG: flavohemoglobin expression-modulating QEGLA motif protein [Gammaproteobacteria bacterium]|nr:flavohemoglobin expression-modulating QEGLA motif protein [Gammaproteobacteria bacterium]
MHEISEQSCLNFIQNGQCFQAIIENSFEIKIEDYGFFICTAIHDGHQLREELKKKCLLDETERLYEEAPCTGEMICSMPITLIGLNSRYEYDLNRPLESCIYEEPWGKTVWKTPLSSREIKISQKKHALFYRILGALIKKIETIHGNCLIYDIHSYNHHRFEEEAPTFNIGTKQVQAKKWNKVVKHWGKSLAVIQLPNLETRSSINETYLGQGYLASFVKKYYKKTLILPTEIKKIYMDENSGEIYHLVINDLKIGLKEVILANALFFSKQAKPKTPKRRSQLLSSKIDPGLVNLDKKLFKLCRGIETLSYINPKNIVKEKKQFFLKNFNYTPEFTYRQLEINPFEFREKLYRLPEYNVTDISIQKMYRDVIDSFATKIDLLATIGTEKFLYNSLRYYGEPSVEDIDAAHFLLYAKEYEQDVVPTIDATEAKDRFILSLKEYDIDCKVVVTNKIIASAMVDNSKKTILINKSIRINEMELQALIHHELGVHMVTTMNSREQQLNVFKLGLPGNTYTQEGLAILSEYMTGNLSLQRLKTLALRVIAVKLMVDNYDFSHTFKTLVNDYNVKYNEAFKLTARVYRGGGFTKDFLYLRGLKDALKLTQVESLSNLYVGKTSFEYLKVINEMIERELVSCPKHLPMYLRKDVRPKENPILDYLLDSAI